MSDTPQVWIGCLAAYNAGNLHGEWIDATDVDTLNEGRAAVLASSPVAGAEEAFVADYNGFGDLASSLGEYPDFEKVAEIGALIEEHDGAFIAYAGNVGAEYATAEGFQEAYAGEWDSEEEFAENLADDLGYVGEGWPANCIDWEKAWRELNFGGDYYSVRDSAGTLYVFRGC